MRKSYLSGSKDHKIPAGVWGIGLSNLLINLSTTMVYSISAVFLTTVLGASMALFGFIDGFVEAIALSVRVGSGWTSDHLHKRKPLLYVGYVLALVSSVLMALATTVGMFFSARIVNRLSNGLQAAPRDALVGDIAPKEIKGAAFGLRHTLAVIGSLIGPLIVLWLMYVSSDDFRFVFYLSAIPAVLGVVFLFLLVREPLSKNMQKAQKKERFSFKLLKELWKSSHGYWGLVFLGGIFMMSRFSEGFMILRMKDLGLETTWVAGVMLVMNLFNALSAYPMGRLSDKYDRRLLMRYALLFLVAANFFLAFSPSWLIGYIGVALWGIQMGAIQSLLMGMIIDYAQEKKYRALAFGVFYCVSGIVHLFTNLIAGYLWDSFTPAAPFVYSAAFAVLTFFGTFFLKKVKQFQH